jgi:adenylate kinase family enzyme
MIIHISGSSGTGKTTLGKSLKMKYLSKIIVLDLDDLLHEHLDKLVTLKKSTSFIVKNFNTLHQEFIDKIITKYKFKIIIFVGLSFDLPKGRRIELYGKPAFLHNLKYDVHADKKFFIDIPEELHMKRLFLRSMDELYHDKNWVFKEWSKDHSEGQDMFDALCKYQ